jgi:transposase InsO family protein
MANREPLSASEKQRIFKRKLGGASLVEIAQEIGCSLETVRKWWRVQRDQRVIQVRGRPARGLLSSFAPWIREKAVEFKCAHPHWGPANVKLELKHLASQEPVRLPSDALLSKLFKLVCPEAVQRRQKRAALPGGGQVREAHQRWQMDGKEGLRVGADTVTLLEIHDQASGLMIASQAILTTLPQWWHKLTWQENQQVLRQAFTTWGLPLEIQTDNEGCYVNITDPSFPSLFSLWLAGLGIRHLTSRPAHPTDQAEIERNHRTLGDLAWKDAAWEQIPVLQQALDESRQRYNEEYPSQAGDCHGQAPLTAYPQARTSTRPYHPALESQVFDLHQVDAFLATKEWTRPVIDKHRINLGGHYYLIGRNIPEPEVVIHFLPESRSLRFQSPNGRIIAQLPIKGLDKQDLLGSNPDTCLAPEIFQLPLPLCGGTIFVDS